MPVVDARGACSPCVPSCADESVMEDDEELSEVAVRAAIGAAADLTALA